MSVFFHAILAVTVATVSLLITRARSFSSGITNLTPDLAFWLMYQVTWVGSSPLNSRPTGMFAEFYLYLFVRIVLGIISFK